MLVNSQGEGGVGNGIWGGGILSLGLHKLDRLWLCLFRVKKGYGRSALPSHVPHIHTSKELLNAQPWIWCPKDPSKAIFRAKRSFG